MRKYEKPIIEEENIQIEDIVAVSASLDINDVDIVAPRWGRN